MIPARTLYQLILADFLERIRRSSFLITLGSMVLLGYYFLPAPSANYAVLSFEGYRGIYNSAWVGGSVAILASLWLSLVGFFLVKNTVERDLRTGTGQIIATTPVPRPLYTLGKMLSNFAVLSLMVACIVVSAGTTQLVRGEDLHIDLWALVSPSLFLTLPTVAVVSAITILFETIEWLRSGLGNIVYAALWAVTVVTTIAIATTTAHITPAIDDFTGLLFPLAQMQAAVKAMFPHYKGGVSLGADVQSGPLHTFIWSGMQWPAEIILERLFWIGIALAVALLAALFFTRFDPARGRLRPLAAALTGEGERTEQPVPEITPNSVRLTPLGAAPGSFRLGQLFWSELHLMLTRVPWWWYLVALGLIIATLLVPLDAARQTFYPFVWLWPLLIWSEMGIREARDRTNQLIFSTAHPLLHQFPLQWAAGVCIAFVTASGMAIHFLISGDTASLLALILGALFIPALALILGIWTGTSKFFELLYLLLWYIGALNHIPALDYMGTSRNALAVQMPILLLAGVVLLLVGAYVGRWRQIRI